MLDLKRLNGVFSALPYEPPPEIDEEKERVRRVIAADTMRLLNLNGK